MTTTEVMSKKNKLQVQRSASLWRSYDDALTKYNLLHQDYLNDLPFDPQKLSDAMAVWV